VPLFPFKLGFFKVLKEAKVYLNFDNAWEFCSITYMKDLDEFEEWSWMMVEEVGGQLAEVDRRRLNDIWMENLVILHELTRE
jgi:hypothetical protein